MDLIRIDKEKCTQCQACINSCPVRAITLEHENGFPKVIHDRCIGCGSCLGVCADDAISYRKSKKEVNDLLKGKEEVAAIVDPSISGEFGDITDYRKFVEMIRALGFEYVSEVSFGVDLVAKEYKQLFDDFRGKYYITANCPAMVAYVEKFHPDLLDNLSPIVSPMIATAKVVRKKYGKDLKVVFIGACIATKEEARRYEGDAYVNAVLTFRELRELFTENHIEESRLEYSDFDPPIGYKGSLYPISNGILQAGDISEDLLEGTVVTAEGKRNALHAVEQFEQHTEQIRKHINVFYNEGCIMGPGTSPGGEKYLRRSLVTDYANKRLMDFDHKAWQGHMGEYSKLDLKTEFQNDDQRLPEPAKEKVNEVLKLIGRKPGENIGCESCGFESCGEFARSVAKGLAKPEMCLTFSLRSKDDYINSLKQTNEKLTRNVNELRDSEKKSRREER
ncbi:MAG: 4Fe-4S binding protein, partial [Bacteroidales bacterium]|nr:4Fe-4S binding protein [Bacteroidales bacterium]